MSYVTNIPVSGQTLGGSRDQIRTNFQVLNTTIAENHVAMNAANAGKHEFTEMVAQAGDDTTQIQTGIITHYAKQVGGITEWFFQREGTGAVVGPSFQMSKGDPVVAASGQSFLPGGIIVQWGPFNWNSASTTTNNFFSAFPTAVFKVYLSLTILPITSVICVAGLAISLSQFQVNTRISSGSSSASPGGVYWAIGN